MWKKLLIGVATYLVVGALFGMTTDRESYLCPWLAPSFDSNEYENELRAAELNLDGPIPGVSRSCVPAFNVGERARWLAIATPGWLPLMVRKVVRGEPVVIGNVYLG